MTTTNFEFDSLPPKGIEGRESNQGVNPGSLALHRGDPCEESWEFICYDCGDAIALRCTHEGYVDLETAITWGTERGYRFKDDYPKPGWRCPYHAAWDLRADTAQRTRRAS